MVRDIFIVALLSIGLLTSAYWIGNGIGYLLGLIFGPGVWVDYSWLVSVILATVLSCVYLLRNNSET